MNEELKRRRASMTAAGATAAASAALALAAMAGTAPAAASETVTYSYDALGRLLGTVHSGGPNNGVGSAYAYDHAGNRSQATVGPGVSPTPTAPANLPPTTASDLEYVDRCMDATVNVVANDSDPEGGSLTLISVTQGTKGTAYVLNSTSVKYYAGSSMGQDVLTYTVQDPLGAQANGTLTMAIAYGPCGP